MRTLLIIVLFSICITNCKSKPEKNTKTETTTIETKISNEDHKAYINVVLNPKNESNVNGKVRFIQSEDVVKMTAKISGLSKGVHAIHIHEKSDCTAPDGTSAGGHWNPTAQPHGKWGAETGYHKGDIGNFNVENDEIITFKFSTNEWCIGCGDKTKDIIGKGIIIHQGEDDFVSQPSGAAGSRVSCAGIIK
jgi:Cu-Zn family superoxide dismutase